MAPGEFFVIIFSFFENATFFGMTLDQIRFVSADILLILGALDILLSMVGLIRFPDIYNRLHATTKIATMGAILVLLSVVLKHGFSPMGIKSIVICMFLFLTAPVGGHMIARAAYNIGVPPCSQTVVDAYAGKRQGDYCDDHDFHEGAYVQIDLDEDHDSSGQYQAHLVRQIKKDVNGLTKVVFKEFSKEGDGSDQSVESESLHDAESNESANLNTEPGLGKKSDRKDTGEISESDTFNDEASGRKQ